MDNDMLSSLLNDPDALQNAMKTVSDMLGSPQQPAGAPASKDYDPSAELMERALPVISTILQSGQGAVKPEKRVLLNAVKPVSYTHLDVYKRQSNINLRISC